MEYFVQQLINGLTLGSIYGLIAIGYTMVYGIIGMINFAHGDIFMVGAFIALMVIIALGITAATPIAILLAAFLLVLLIAMALTAVWGWAVERIAYRPLRDSFRLAPLITAIGMSIVLQNYVQIVQGARVKPVQPIVTGGYNLMEKDGFIVSLSNIQIIIMVTTLALMAIFSLIIAKTPLGRAQRACEQDRTMAALLGVNVDRTISLTFVIGASLASVAGLMYLLYYGVIDFFIGFVAGIKAFTAAVLGGIGSLPGAMLGGLIIGLIETFWSAYFTVEYKDVAAFSILVIVLIFLPSGLLGRPEVEKDVSDPAGKAPAKSGVIGPALRDAAIGAGVALLLAIPLLSFRTVQKPGGLILEERWMVALLAVMAVFAGRLLLNLLWWNNSSARDAASSAGGGFKQMLAPLWPYAKWAGPALIVFAVLLPFLPFADRRMLDLAILVLTYVMLGWGLNIVVGLAGLLDLGYVAFYAVGAYSFALLATNFDLSFWICLPLAGILAGFWGIILGFPVLRLRGDYLAIVTLAFGEIIRIVLLNWYQFTGGPDGISGIPKPTLFGLEFKRFGDNTFHGFFGIDYSTTHRFIFLYFIILALAMLTNYVTIRLRRLPIGRAWEALREDEIACRSLGINVTNTKLTAFAIGAMFGGIAGSFFATRQGFISPESFTFLESAIILAIVVLGGMGSQVGVAIAALVMIGGGEYFFREFGSYRMLLFGAAMVAVMVWKPRGLISTRTPTVALKERKAISGDLVEEGSG